MHDPDDDCPALLALDLFGPWPEREGAGTPAAVLRSDGAGPRLELKSAEGRRGSAGLVALLNDLTMEMREQFDLHRQLRTSAEAWLAADAVGAGVPADIADGAAAKAARADLKAVTDAMQAIVRTLEKIDGLQRQLARDRVDADERSEAESDGELAARIEALIEARAAERARALLAAARHGGDDGGADLG